MPLTEQALASLTPELGSTASMAAWASFWASVLIFVVLAAALAVGFQFVYAGRVFPGVRAEGVYLGGLTQDQAEKRIASATDHYLGSELPVTYADTTLRLGVKQLSPIYNPTASAEAALAYGRDGSWLDRLHAQARALLGRYTNVSYVKLDATRLTPYLSQIDNDLNRAVSNAQLSFEGGDVKVTPAVPGRRVDVGLLALAIKSRLRQTSTDAVEVPYFRQAPLIETADVDAVKAQAKQYATGPLTLKTDTDAFNVAPSTIISWLKLDRLDRITFSELPWLSDWYSLGRKTSLSLDGAKLTSYVAELATKTDRAAQNAVLSIADGKASVFVPSHDGATLDQLSAVALIREAASKSGSDRIATLPVSIKKADVNEGSLNDLGINELLSEGSTFFPGSPYTRLINVRAGAKKFNGILLKPGETFSFGALLGDVGPEQGYVPELVILNNHEEKQYGGGLCQVSSTAYRAALLAGLPIVERHNHSFAISYYTNPYGVPGVDATIYYPQVDFKFLNDTGHYILIQTIMSGTTLKFDFYGTKAKSGIIRGPFFVSGTNDATLPSHTVFYRDVLDLNGAVTKTDEVHTWYKSSKDFPITPQFN